MVMINCFATLSISADLFFTNILLIELVNFLFVGYFLCFVILLKIKAIISNITEPESTGESI